MHMLARALLMIAAALAASPVMAAPGAPDATYGDGGMATFELEASDDGEASLLLAMRRLADGRIIVLSRIGLSRLMPDGTLDPTFGNGGTVALVEDAAIPGSQPILTHVTSLSVASAGRVLVGGGKDKYPAVARLGPDGLLDGTFGTAGVAVLDKGSLFIHQVAAVEELSDGRVLVVGKTAFPQTTDSWVARLTAGGSFDPSFGIDGLRSTAHPDIPTHLSQDLNGEWLFAGHFRTGESPTSPIRFTGSRIAEDGAPVLSYGVNGRQVSVDIAGVSQDLGLAAILARQGSLLFVGSATLKGFHNDPQPGCRGDLAYWYRSVLVMQRFGPQGALDPAFGHLSGSLATYLGAFDAWPSAATIDEDGRIVVAGKRAGTDCIYEDFVARFTSNGALDPSFGTAGVAVLPPGFGVERVADLASLPGGAILALAHVDHLSGGLATIRLEGGGTPPSAGEPGDVDGDGIPDALEYALGHDPLLKDNDIFADARLFAMQQYRDFLGREGDEAGIVHWTAQIQGGIRSRAQMVETFFNSAEFQGVSAPVVRLYYAYFRRVPDYAGVNFWIGQHRGGASLGSVSDAFAASPEFVTMYGALDNAQFVTLVYQNILGRDPDATGLAYWAGRLDSSALSRGAVMLAFSESAEYRAIIRDHVYETMMYMGMLRRGPDEAGYAHWVGYMDAGNPGIALIQGFVDSAEYKARFLP